MTSRLLSPLRAFLSARVLSEAPASRRPGVERPSPRVCCAEGRDRHLPVTASNALGSPPCVRPQINCTLLCPRRRRATTRRGPMHLFVDFLPVKHRGRAGLDVAGAHGPVAEATVGRALGWSNAGGRSRRRRLSSHAAAPTDRHGTADRRTIPGPRGCVS
jgi:hypothetical protein